MDQQEILNIFIMEAKEHLQTLESGLLDLPAAVADPKTKKDRIDEMFRAAHSVKGGAAMMGYGSIQKVAHRLEDALKVLKENEVPVEESLVSLFLRGYDVLQDLIEKLQSPAGLNPEEAETIAESTDPTFSELQEYLNQLLSQERAGPDRVKALLKQMLEWFKGEATPESRQQLQSLCAQLGSLAPGEKGWQDLVKTAKAAIANPRHSYRTLAPAVIKELKQGSDWMELGRGDKIAPSQGLQQLATASLPQILLPVEPTAAANILLQVFNQQQLSQLVQLLKARD